MQAGGQGVPGKGNSWCKCPGAGTGCHIQETNCSEEGGEW